MQKIETNHHRIINKANEVCSNMVKRGGGVTSVYTEVLENTKNSKLSELNIKPMLIVNLKFDVCDSMGANMINSSLEHVAFLVEELTGGRAGAKILSNLCVDRRAMAKFTIPVS